MRKENLYRLRGWVFAKVELAFMLTFRYLRRLSYASNGKAFTEAEDSDSSWHAVSGEFGIVITTFEPRFRLFALPLISAIREITKTPITVVINGNYEGPAGNQNLKSFLGEISKLDFVYPVTFCDMRGCAELWNSGVKHLNKKINLILNDDISIHGSTFLPDVLSALKQIENYQLFTINGSWSHFLIHQDLFKQIGMFDERFLGFGWEDADYKLRYLRKFKRLPPNINLASFVNIIDQSHDSSVQTGLGKYSLFNREYYLAKYPEQRLGANLDPEIQTPFPGLDQNHDYSGTFRKIFYHCLVENDPEKISNDLVNFLNANYDNV